MLSDLNLAQQPNANVSLISLGIAWMKSAILSAITSQTYHHPLSLQQVDALVSKTSNGLQHPLLDVFLIAPPSSIPRPERLPRVKLVRALLSIIGSRPPPKAVNLTALLWTILTGLRAWQPVIALQTTIGVVHLRLVRSTAPSSTSVRRLYHQPGSQLAAVRPATAGRAATASSTAQLSPTMAAKLPTQTDPAHASQSICGVRVLAWGIVQPGRTHPAKLPMRTGPVHA